LPNLTKTFYQYKISRLIIIEKKINCHTHLKKLILKSLLADFISVESFVIVNFEQTVNGYHRETWTGITGICT